MSEVHHPGDTPPDKLAAVLALAAGCGAGLAELVQAHHAYLSQFDRLRTELHGRLCRLQGLVQGMTPGRPAASPAEPGEPPFAEGETPEDETPEGETPDEKSDDSRRDAGGESGAATEAVPVGGPNLDAGQPPADFAALMTGSAVVRADSNTEGAGGDPGTLAVKPTRDELKQAILTSFPMCHKLEAAAKAAGRELVQQADLPATVRAALDAIATNYKALGPKMKPLLDSGDVPEGQRQLREQAWLLVNKIKELDKFDPPSGQHLDSVRRIRKYLWEFIQEATGNEIKEVSPPPGVKLHEWLLQNGYTPPGNYVDTILASNTKYSKDCVIRTMYPGYVRMIANGGQSEKLVRGKARVQVSSGPSQVQLDSIG